MTLSTLKAKIILLTFLSVSASIASEGYTYNRLPDGLPKGLPEKIKGNYRIIEHNTMNDGWVAYDTKSYVKDSEGVIMKAPIVYYDHFGSKWTKQTVHESLHNQYIPELVTIIDAKAKLVAGTNTTSKPLTSQQAVSQIHTALKNKSWLIKSFPYKNNKGKNALLICGVNTQVKSDTIRAIWYSSNGQVYNVNGIAKGNTPHFNFTFDVDISDGLRVCQGLK